MRLSNKKGHLRSPQGWQLDPQQVTAVEVQYWQEGTMRGKMSLDEARYRVENGTAFVISDTAIGHLQGGYLNS